MSFEITGKLVAKFDVVQRSESFKTREFVIENAEENNGRTFSSFIKFQCVQDKTSMPDRFNIGDQVKVQFNIKGSKWEKDGKVNYITNLDAWRIESVQIGRDNSTAEVNYNDIPPTDNVDDLPF